MKQHILFEDTGLNAITFVNFGNDVLVEITDIYDGDIFAHLFLKNVFKFIYSRKINDDGFSGSYLAGIFVTELENAYQLQFEPDNQILIYCLDYEVILLDKNTV